MSREALLAPELVDPAISLADPTLDRLGRSVHSWIFTRRLLRFHPSYTVYRRYRRPVRLHPGLLKPRYTIVLVSLYGMIQQVPEVTIYVL